MDNAIETLEREDVTAKIYHEEYLDESPRDWDNLGTIVYWHRRSVLGDVDGSKEYDSPQDFIKWAKEHKVIMLPLYAYEHGNIVLKAGHEAKWMYPFNDRWDSGQLGFIYVEPQKVKQEYSVTRIGSKTRAKVEQVLKSEIETFNQYLNGDVFYYVLEGEGIDWESLGGLYGFDYAKQQAQEALDYAVKQRDASNDSSGEETLPEGYIETA